MQICKLLFYYGYSIEPAAIGKPHQNGFIEVENREIGHNLQYMHYSANMQLKYWLHSLTYFTCANNVSLHANNNQIPLSHLINKPLDIKHLRT